MILKMLSAQDNCIGAPSAERENKTTQNIERNLQVRLSANKHSLFSTNQQEVIREYKENSCDCGRSTIQLLPTLVGSRMAWYSWICAVTCIHACQSHARQIWMRRICLTMSQGIWLWSREADPKLSQTQYTTRVFLFIGMKDFLTFGRNSGIAMK